MTRPSDDTLLAFLEGRLDAEARGALLDQLDADPDLARELRVVAAGLEAVRVVADAPDAAPTSAPPAVAGAGRGVPPWWVAAAVAATLLVSVPATRWLASRTGPAPAASVFAGRPDAPAPSFVLVLQSTWPDADTVAPDERLRRAAEYWEWTSSLAESGVLVAAGDLRWEPGRRLLAGGTPAAVTDAVVDQPDFMVGMLALRVESYDDALAIARECPHLRYGGSVAVRQVGSGFVTVDGRSDWSD